MELTTANSFGPWCVWRKKLRRMWMEHSAARTRWIRRWASWNWAAWTLITWMIGRSRMLGAELGKIKVESGRRCERRQMAGMLKLWDLCSILAYRSRLMGYGSSIRPIIFNYRHNMPWNSISKSKPPLKLGFDSTPTTTPTISKSGSTPTCFIPTRLSNPWRPPPSSRSSPYSSPGSTSCSSSNPSRSQQQASSPLFSPSAWQPLSIHGLSKCPIIHSSITWPSSSNLVFHPTK